MTPYESSVDRQIREAQEAGAFDNLRGAGKPLPGLTGREDPNWWVRQWVDREDLKGMLPPSLVLGRAIEDLPGTVAGERSEAVVREVVAELNAQIRTSRLRGIDGPPIFLHTQDVERVVREWREQRAENSEHDGAPGRASEPQVFPRRSRGLLARLRRLRNSITGSQRSSADG